jgi:hypothetical protein
MGPPEPTDLVLATAALRSLSEAYPTATAFRPNMVRDGERVIAETEAAGPVTEAFLAAKAAFRAATGVPAAG